MSSEGDTRVKGGNSDADDDGQCLQNSDGGLSTFCGRAGPECRGGECKGVWFRMRWDRVRCTLEEEEERSRLDSGNVI